MVRLRPLFLALVLCFAFLAPRAQELADDPAREADDGATTVEARQSALASLLAAASQHRDAGEALEAARALNRAGRFQMRLNLLQDALATYRQALAILEQTPDSQASVDSLNGLGEAYGHLSKCPEAQTFLQQAIALSEQNGYAAGKAQALLTLSDCQNYSDHALALRTAQEALALWQAVGRKREIAYSYATIGGYQLAQNNLAEAEQSQTAALGLWRELGVADEQAEALINLGYIEYRKGAWQNVFTFLMQARSLLDERAEPYKMGQIAAGIAEAFIESGLPENGLDEYSRALDYYRQTQNQRAATVAVWGMGKAYYLSGDYPAALTSFKSALADAEAIKEPTIAAMCNDFIGRTYKAMGENGDALSYFEIALDLYTRVGNSMEAARVRAFMGQAYQQQGKVEKARAYYQRALETFSSRSDKVNESAALYALGTLELGQNNLDVAEGELLRSIEVTENMRRVSTSRDLTAAFSATVHGRYESYIECLMREQKAGRGRELEALAFETSERARARSLAELLGATGTSLLAGLDPKLAEREKELRQSLRAKEDYRVSLLGGSYRKEDLDALDAEIARLDAEYKQVAETIRARYPSYEQVTRPTAWDLKRIQERVVADDNTVLLEYSLGQGSSYVWAVTRDRITSRELPAQSRVNGAAEKVYRLLATKPEGKSEEELTKSEEELTKVTRELGEMVLSPVAEELGGRRRVIVVADGALDYVPFQVLPSPSSDGEPLVARYEIVNAPSASVLGELREERERRQPAAKLLAAFGDPVFEADYAQRKGAGGGGRLGDGAEGGGQLALVSAQKAGTKNLHYALRDLELNGDTFDPSVLKGLFYAKRELANLREATSGTDPLMAEEFDATRERLLGSDLTQYAILHFATHGFLDPKRPEHSGLVLSTVDRDGREQDGFVTLQDIYGLRAPADLVVLSACRTALGKEVRGEGLIGLTRGFMYAGASSVVSSLWKVDDEATSELMKRFYEGMLQRGMAPSEALRAAQNQIRRQPQWHSPYYWAAFTLQGEYRQIIRVKPASGAPLNAKVAAVALVLALLGGAALLYRRRGTARVAS